MFRLASLDALRHRWGMSRQYNKGIKRQRRNAYIKRRKKTKRAK